MSCRQGSGARLSEEIAAPAWQSWRCDICRPIRVQLHASEPDASGGPPIPGWRSWTYQLDEEGHRLLQHAGDMSGRHRYKRRTIVGYSRVVHDIQLNAWVLAYRRTLGAGLLGWDGETTFDPPTGLHRDRERFDDDWSPESLRDDRPRSVCPDAVLEIAGDTLAAQADSSSSSTTAPAALTRTTTRSTATTHS